jgi:hypothetical protein
MLLFISIKEVFCLASFLAEVELLANTDLILFFLFSNVSGERFPN